MHDDATATPSGPSETYYKVTGRLPTGRSAEDMRPLALAAGLAPERVEAMIQAMGDKRAVRLAKQVTKKQAEKIKRDFSAAGLEVFLEPLLVLAEVVHHPKTVREKCPVCGEIGVLTDRRQCPHCGAFVDKVNAEHLRKKKLLEEERARLAKVERLQSELGLSRQDQDTQEEEMRMRIRAELEAAAGAERGWRLPLFRGQAGLLRAAVWLGSLGAAFAGGWAMHGTAQDALRLDAQPAASAGGIGEVSLEAVNRVLTGLGPQTATPVPAPNAEPPVPGRATESLAAPLARAELTAAAASAPEFVVPGLVRDAVGADESLLNIALRRRQAQVAEAAPAGGATAGDTPAPVEPATTSPTQTQQTADFALRLAQLDQLPRAQELILKLKDKPEVASDPALALSVRMAEYEIAAWSLRSAARPAEAAEALRAELMRLPDPAHRAVALGRAGVALARGGGAAPGQALSFVLRGGEALKSITDPARRNTAGSDWLLSMSRLLTADIQEHARTGRWAKVAGVAEQMQVLVDQTKPGLTQAGLRGMQVKVRNLLGEAEAGAQLLEQGLAEVAGLGTRLDRAEALRSLAHESGDPGSPRVAAAVSAQVQALDGQKGLDVALALGKLALLHADAGRFDAHAALKARALLVPGLSARDTRILETELNTGAGLAKAEQLHRAGQFGEAEKAVRQLAYQLL